MEKISDWKCISIQRLKFFLNEISLIEKCSFYTEIGVFYLHEISSLKKMELKFSEIFLVEILLAQCALLNHKIIPQFTLYLLTQITVSIFHNFFMMTNKIILWFFPFNILEKNFLYNFLLIIWAERVQIQLKKVLISDNFWWFWYCHSFIKHNFISDRKPYYFTTDSFLLAKKNKKKNIWCCAITFWVALWMDLGGHEDWYSMCSFFQFILWIDKTGNYEWPNILLV